MRLQTWEPDIRTLLERIRSDEINLQPDFQRGEVWGAPKKRRLIDTIFRDWHIPPVHVVVDSETQKYEVLDGQQRLAAIRDFAEDQLTIDGFFPPEDPELQKLHGLTCSMLPQAMLRRFNNYALQIIRITDYEPEEPGELFFRLNQPTNLTAAEQRNAFFGPARSQVKSIVDSFSAYSIRPESLGFTNSRMAYNDVVAKICYAHHIGTIGEKITATTVTGMFRSGQPFHDEAVSRVEAALGLFGAALERCATRKFNKATVFSWLAFLSLLRQASSQEPSQASVGAFMEAFESLRHGAGSQEFLYGCIAHSFEEIPLQNRQILMSLFNDRAASRVADVSSVLTRDLVMWVFHSAFEPRRDGDADRLGTVRGMVMSELTAAARNPRANLQALVEREASGTRWGALR